MQFGVLLLVYVVSVLGCGAAQVLRVGYFPNVTHAQGVIGYCSTQEGQGIFEKSLGKDVTVEWYAYNAGPSAMEALLAGSIDVTYVGPNPAMNAFIASRGRNVRILAGSAVGGAALLVRPGAEIHGPKDFGGKRVATPQFANTQDVACRVWLQKQGFHITLGGGDVHILPTKNPDQLLLFKHGDLDAVWTVEPWVSRLEKEAGAQIFLEQADALTTILVANVLALKDKPELVKRFLAAHKELTVWIKEHPQEAQIMVRKGIKLQTRADFPADVISKAWSRLHFTSDFVFEQIETLYQEATSLNLLKSGVDLHPILSNLCQ